MMRSILCSFVLMTLGAGSALAAAARPCLGSVPLGSFRLLMERPKANSSLLISEVNRILPGDKLKYEPVHLRPQIKDKARISLILVPPLDEPSKKLTVLEEKKASEPAEWDVPVRSSVVGVVFGPQGLDLKKVDTLVQKNEDLISELADYAQQTATVEALVQTLSDYEQSAPGSRNLNAVLSGFSTQYGVSLPKLDASTPTDQQAALLLRAVLPSVSAYDPLSASRSSMVQQSAGLAASVAGLFFGTPVTLAAGGAALFQNLHTMMFPETDFHSAFVQSGTAGNLELCSKGKESKSRTRVAYLWALRIPDAAPPVVSIPSETHVPIGWKSNLRVTCETVAQLKLLPRIRAWELVSREKRSAVPVTVSVGGSDATLALDLTKAKLPAGEYHLAALWDWDPLEVKGTVTLHPFGELRNAKLTPESEDRLVYRSGLVSIELAGADFEFVEKAAIKKAGESKASSPVSLALPRGADGGEQSTMKVEIDTSAFEPGEYLLELTQRNGVTQEIPLTIHPPTPQLLNLPLRVNLGETKQTVSLRGSGLERISKLTSDGASWDLAAVPSGSHDLSERQAVVRLTTDLKKGDKLAALMEVNGIHRPIQISDALQVVGPRPKILSANASFNQQTDVALREGEIPAGRAVSFAIQTGNAGERPALEVSCRDSSLTKRALVLRPGDREGSTQLDIVGEGVLYLSVDPGTVGQSGCELTATLSEASTGSSDPYLIGRVIRLPQISKFSLTDQKLSPSLYSGTLTGRDLQLIEKTGWTEREGYGVQGIPTPWAGNPQEQILKIALPWPPPTPQAPVYIWLRGESEGRKSKANY
jgi:hypothetical protein